MQEREREREREREGERAHTVSGKQQVGNHKP